MAGLRLWSYTCGHIERTYQSPVSQAVQEHRVVNAQVVQADVLCSSCQLLSASSVRSQTGYSDVLGGERFGTQLRATDVGYIEERFVFDLPEQEQANQPGPANFPMFYWEEEDAEINQSPPMGGLGVDPSLLPEANAIANAARAAIHPADDPTDDLGDGLSLVDIDELFNDMETGAVKDIPSAHAATNDGGSADASNLLATSPAQPSELPATTAETGAVIAETENTLRETTPLFELAPSRQPRPRRGRGRPKRVKRGGAKTKPGTSSPGPTILPDVQTPEPPEVPSNDGKGGEAPEGNKENEGPDSKREGSPVTAESHPELREAKRPCGLRRPAYHLSNLSPLTLEKMKEARENWRAPGSVRVGGPPAGLRRRRQPMGEEPTEQEDFQPRRSDRLKSHEEKTPENDK